MKTTSLNVTINKVELDFSEDSKTPLLPCKYCGEQTRGRETTRSAVGRKSRTRPACMGCSMKAAFSNAFKTQRATQ
jgi:hypothetical protein